jgi:hypothetical protein
MLWPDRCARHVRSIALALVGASALLWTSLAGPPPAGAAPALGTDQLYPAASAGGAGTYNAAGSGPLDVGITNVWFQNLPSIVHMGQEVTIAVAAPPGARCAGSIAFRNGPTMALDETGVGGGVCAWTVVIPRSQWQGTAILQADVVRSGQSMPVSGVFFVVRP